MKYGQVCPISKAAEVLGEPWTLLIVRELLLGTTRFNDFQRALSGISPSLLTKRLRQLEDHEIVVRKSLFEQRRAEYHLTAAGRELEPIVVGLGEWGMRWARGQMSDDELDVEMLMFDFCRRIDANKLPGGQTVLHFALSGLTKFPYWWIVVVGDDRQLCLHPPAGKIDLRIETDVRTLAEIWTGDVAIREARQHGKLVLKGSSILSRSIGDWLRTGVLSHIRPAGRQESSRP
ncbi:MAG: helix-turn-helix domain-containing protein [Bryobacterales bacterium]|nr:helix-turn-helix domain-containing protein [Bryobacterales bacterium]